LNEEVCLEQRKDKYYVYILKCQDGTYYTGFTRDLEKRQKEHLGGYGAKYTLDKKAEALLYYETFDSQEEALHREKQLKGWTKAKKDSLISGQISHLKKLSISRQSPRYKKISS
jgi:putative endonuclease